MWSHSSAVDPPYLPRQQLDIVVHRGDAEQAAHEQEVDTVLGDEDEEEHAQEQGQGGEPGGTADTVGIHSALGADQHRLLHFLKVPVYRNSHSPEIL